MNTIPTLPDLRDTDAALMPLPVPSQESVSYKLFVKPYKQLWRYLMVVVEAIQNSQPTKHYRLNIAIRAVELLLAITAWLAADYVVFTIQSMIVMFAAMGIMLVFGVVLLVMLAGASGSSRRSRSGLRMRSSIPLPGPFSFRLW